VNEFDFVKGADTSVRSQIIGWNDKVREYLRKFFDGDSERVRGIDFGDSISKIVYLIEKVVTESDTFIAVSDVQGRVQAGAIVEEYLEHLYIDTFTNAAWNVLKTSLKL